MRVRTVVCFTCLAHCLIPCTKNSAWHRIDTQIRTGMNLREVSCGWLLYMKLVYGRNLQVSMQLEHYGG